MSGNRSTGFMPRLQPFGDRLEIHLCREGSAWFTLRSRRSANRAQRERSQGSRSTMRRITFHISSLTSQAASIR